MGLTTPESETLRLEMGPSLRDYSSIISHQGRMDL